MAPKPATTGTLTVTDKEIPDERPENGATDSLENNSVKTSTMEAPMQEQQYVTGAKLIFICTSTTLTYFLVMLDLSIVSVAIPSISSEFNSLLDIGWYVGLLNLNPIQSHQTHPSLGTAVLMLSPILPFNPSVEKFTRTLVPNGRS